MEDYIGSDILTAAHGVPHVGAGGNALREGTAYGEPTQEQVLGGKCSPQRGDHAQALHSSRSSPRVMDPYWMLEAHEKNLHWICS